MSCEHDWVGYGIGLSHRDGERCSICVLCGALAAAPLSALERERCGCGYCAPTPAWREWERDWADYHAR